MTSQSSNLYGTPLMQLAKQEGKIQPKPAKQDLFPKIRVKIKSMLGCSPQDDSWGYIVEGPNGQEAIRWLPVRLKAGSFIEENKDLWQ